MVIATVHSFVDSLEHIVGFFLVFLALALLWGLTLGLGQVFKPAKAGAAAPADVGGAADSGPDEEEVAAIAATVACLMGHRSRIVSIRSAAKDWSREGRREHFASHRLR
jgi:Na+-transporting methylmalonyl-CoA/oxaloacetate decarboxylase gamma subunit